MKFSSISNVKLSDKVIQQIMDNIDDGELKPGEKLPSEPELAANMGVSRGILREALTILQARGIIYRKPKEGTFIAPDVMDVLNGNPVISVKEATYLDLIEVMECFEARVVEKVIELASQEEINELMELVEGRAEKQRENSLDHYFHYRLAELSGNVIFCNFIDTYYDVIEELKNKSSKKQSRTDAINEEHKKIVDAIQERNVEKAREQMLYHLNQVRENALSKDGDIEKEKCL